MTHRALICTLLPAALLAACVGPFARPAPYAFDKKGDLVEFNYGWSAEAARQPALVKRLRSDLERSFKDALAVAEADRATARAANRLFVGHRYSRRWTTAGQSTRLLSLYGAELASGGTEPPRRSAAGLLWDRSARDEVKVGQLFGSGEALDALVPQPCLSENGLRPTRCAAAEPTLVPTDRNGNRRFDHFRLVAPAATGEANVELPVTASLLAAIKPAFRAGFEVAQPQ